MFKAHLERAEEAINQTLEVIEEHLLSLPENEARERLKAIDRAHAAARVSARKRQVPIERRFSP